MKIVTGVLISLLAVAPITAQAQRIFICKDVSGRTLTSDRPIPECAGRAIKEMDRNGVVRRVIPAPLTAEQTRQNQLEEEKRKAAEAAVVAQRRNDHALLARFHNESDIEIARARAVDVVQEQIRRESASLAAAEKRKKDAEAEQAVAGIREKIKEYEAEMAQINARFDAMLKRYRELTLATASR